MKRFAPLLLCALSAGFIAAASLEEEQKQAAPAADTDAVPAQQEDTAAESGLAGSQGAAGGTDGETPVLPELHRYTLPESGGLRLTVYGDEQLAMLQGAQRQIHAAGERVVQNEYDAYGRIAARCVWNGMSFDSLEPDSLIRYSYSGESPAAESSVEIRAAEKRRIQTIYNENGLAVSRETYVYDAEAASGANASIVCAEAYEYTPEGDILLYRKTQYGQNTEEIYETRYTYTEKAASPDFTVYENGVPKRRRIYDEKDTYTETFFFDGGFAVSVYYEHGFRLREEFMHRSHVTGTKEYARPEPPAARAAADSGSADDKAPL